MKHYQKSIKWCINWHKLEKNSTLSVFVLIDLSAAFDTINHSLLNCLASVAGIQDSTLQWFKSYLWNRSQKVLVVKSYSN